MPATGLLYEAFPILAFNGTGPLPHPDMKNGTMPCSSFDGGPGHDDGPGGFGSGPGGFGRAGPGGAGPGGDGGPGGEKCGSR